MAFTALRSNKPLIISVETSGQVRKLTRNFDFTNSLLKCKIPKIRITVDDMALAGEIIQAMATFLNLEDIQVTANFPDEMESITNTIRQVI